MTHIRDAMKSLPPQLAGMRPTLGGNDAELGLKKRPKTNKLDKKYGPTLSNYQAYYTQICLRWRISSKWHE